MERIGSPTSSMGTNSMCTNSMNIRKSTALHELSKTYSMLTLSLNS